MIQIKLIKITDNFHKVEFDNRLTIYFSYETPIGYSTEYDIVITENKYTKTTAKHINVISRLGSHFVLAQKDFLDHLMVEINNATKPCTETIK